MMIVDPEKLFKCVCRLKCGTEIGTAFLISTDKVITASHCLLDYIGNSSVIELEFPNLPADESPITKRNAWPIRDITDPIAVLQLNKPLIGHHLTFVDYAPRTSDKYETYGFPLVKRDVGSYHVSTVSRKIQEGMEQPFDWDLDLSHETNIEDFQGLSGAPLIVESKLVGVVLAQSLTNGKAISLGGISCPRFKDVLLDAEVNMMDNFEYDNTIYELDKYQYEDNLFVAKLESAEIHEHEMCEQEFYNAEIYRHSVEGRNVPEELRNYNNLTNTLKGIWFTQYISYTNEKNGNELLNSVYKRIEDLDQIKIQGLSPEVDMFVKKGTLHLLADKCKVGWVKNYKMRVKEYLRGKGE